MQLEKARIYPVDQKDKVFYVQFNPNTLQYRADQNSNSEKHSTEPKLHQNPAVGMTGRSSLSLTLFFYTFRSETDYSDVRENINRLRPYMGHWADDIFIRGENIGFAWGSIMVEGYLESMDVSYQMFASSGTPVQAEVQLSIVGEDKGLETQSINHIKELEFDTEAKVSWGEGDPAENNQDIAWLFEGECGN